MVKTVLRMTMLVLSTTIIAQSAFPKPDSSMQCDGDSSQLFQRSFVGQGTHCVISLDLCWLCNWYFSDIISDTWLQFWPPGVATWPECKFGQQVAKLPSFQKLAIRLCHSYCHILPSIVLFPYLLVLSWYLYQPESHQLSLLEANICVPWEVSFGTKATTDKKT